MVTQDISYDMTYPESRKYQKTVRLISQKAEDAVTFWVYNVSQRTQGARQKQEMPDMGDFENTNFGCLFQLPSFIANLGNNKIEGVG